MLSPSLNTPAPQACPFPKPARIPTYHTEEGFWPAVLQLFLLSVGLKSLPGVRPSS